MRILFLAAVLMLFSLPALAHKLNVFATAEGPLLRGYAYFSGNSRAVEAHLTITIADGEVVFEGKTAADGSFHYQARHPQDHIIAIDSGDGHVARFTVPADELPLSFAENGSPSAPSLPLPPAPPATAPPEAAEPASGAVPATDVASPPSFQENSLPEAVWDARMERAIARQIRPLREQIEAYQEKIWWHDVLGGLGYIIGLSSLALAVARQRSRTAPLSCTKPPP